VAAAVDPAGHEKAQPSATVMIPTFRRPEALGRALDALADQSDPGIPWDLVVIDNNDPPGTEVVFRAHKGAIPVPTRRVLERRRGSAYARNRGIAEATGTVTVMIDDDVVPARDWLRRLVAPIIDGTCDATGGRVVLDPSVPLPRWFDERGIGGYLTLFDAAESERDLLPDEYVVTANAAFRTDVLRASGGFDPALGPQDGIPLVGDDVLLTRRVRSVGGRVRYVPEAVVIHELPPARLRPAYLLRRAYAQGRSDWILDRAELSARRFRGARVAADWLAGQLRSRLAEGPFRRDVAFHAACVLIRTIGALREGFARRTEE